MSVYITGCEKDAEHVFNDSPLENRYDSVSIDNIYYLNNDIGNIVILNSSDSIILKGVPEEQKTEVLNYLNSVLNDISSELLDYYYGTPNWNLATLNTSNDNPAVYIISVPLFQKDTLTSIIFYTHYQGGQALRFVSKESINSIVQQRNTSSQFIDYWIIPVTQFSIINYAITGNANYNYTNWIESALSTTNNQINFRELRWVLTSYAKNGKIYLYTWSIVDCDDGSQKPWWQEWENSGDHTFPPDDWGNNDTGSGGGGGYYGEGGNGWGYNPPSNTELYKNFECQKENRKLLKTLDPDFYNNFYYTDPCLDIQEYNPDDYFGFRLRAFCAKYDNNSNLDNSEFLEEFKNKVLEVKERLMRNALECSECQDAYNNFKSKYGCELTDEQRYEVAYNIFSCVNQEKFEEEAKLIYLEKELNLETEEKEWLEENISILNEIFEYINKNTYPDLDFKRIIWTMSSGGEITLKDYTDTYDIWGDLNNPPTYPPSRPEEIENGITIQSTETIEPTIYTNIFAQSPARGNTEDLLAETDADDKGIALNPNLPDYVYFASMKLLFYATTILDHDMKDIADGFRQQFKDNIGGTRNDPLLDAKIKEHPTMRNYIKHRFSYSPLTLI